MRKPIFVYVVWSESGDIPDRELYTFADFELKALGVAMAYTTGGYLKTKVQVLFSDGECYECRLDLAKNDTHGFRQHAESMVRHFDKAAAKDPEEFTVKCYRNCVDFLKSIDWTPAAQAA